MPDRLFCFPSSPSRNAAIKVPIGSSPVPESLSKVDRGRERRVLCLVEREEGTETAGDRNEKKRIARRSNDKMCSSATRGRADRCMDSCSDLAKKWGASIARQPNDTTHAKDLQFLSFFSLFNYFCRGFLVLLHLNTFSQKRIRATIKSSIDRSFDPMSLGDFNGFLDLDLRSFLCPKKNFCNRVCLHPSLLLCRLVRPQTNKKIWFFSPCPI